MYIYIRSVSRISINHFICVNIGGFSVTRGVGNYNNSENLSRLNSQLSFTRQDSTLSYISEENESTVGDEMRTQNEQRKTTHSYGSIAGFGMGTSTWDESNSVMFSVSPNKRNKIVGGSDLLGGLDSMENQVYSYDIQ